MKKRIALAVIVTIFLLGTTSCIPRSQYDKLQNDYAQLQTQYQTSQNDNTQMKRELNDIRQICPPHNFTTKGELQAWAKKHIQQKGQYAEDTFLSVVEVCNLALRDGYLVHPAILPNDAGTLFTVGCQAFVNDNLYLWNPEDNELTLFPWSTYGFSK